MTIEQELELERAQRRKQTGEVFTPIELVDEILDKLPEEVFTDPSKTFLDPACGNGNFLVRVVLCKIAYGSTVRQALETTYGVELMPDNVEECKERLLEIAIKHDKEFDNLDEAITEYGKIVDRNIVCSDAFKWDFEEWKSKELQEHKIEELLEE